MTKKPTVCVLRYNHKHGTDISVYPSMAAAERSCIDIVLQNIHELPDPMARTVLDLIILGEYVKAQTFYEEYLEESLDVTEPELHNEDCYPVDYLTRRAERAKGEIDTRALEAAVYGTTVCSLCGKSGPTPDAHLHQDKYIGECCWDERLKATE